jgi:hypothetical protein
VEWGMATSTLGSREERGLDMTNIDDFC